MFKNVELRKLPTGSLNRVSETLETNGDWRKVMILIPKDPTAEEFESKYSSEQIRAIEEYAKTTRRTCAEILFDEWGTSGKNRPTLGMLQQIIIQAQVFKAADEIALMLQEPLPQRPDRGPALQLDTNNLTYLLNANRPQEDEKRNIKEGQPTESTARMKSVKPSLSKLLRSFGKKPTDSVRSVTESESSSFTSESYESGPNIPKLDMLMNNSKKSAPISQAYPRHNIHIDTTILQNKQLIQFDYKELEDITCRFSGDFIYGPTGPTGKIGSGGFGDVFAGWHPTHGNLAVKKFKNLSLLTDNPDLMAQTFNSEVKCLSQLRHENIVPIIGYSIQKVNVDVPSLCIVTQYIEGGSLEQNLSAKRLSNQHRMIIMEGTAKGLRYIHNRDSMQTGKEVEQEESTSSGDSFIIMQYIHGDVKSANILLTRDYQPKLCDFGLAKQYKSTMISHAIMGTTAYMSPERLNGTVTQKADIFSFGIVLLELLTGLQSIIKSHNGTLHIRDYINQKSENGDITQLLDPTAGKWTKAAMIYELANKCLVHDYNERPTVDMVCDELEKIIEYKSIRFDAKEKFPENTLLS